MSHTDAEGRLLSGGKNLSVTLCSPPFLTRSLKSLFIWGGGGLFHSVKEVQVGAKKFPHSSNDRGPDFLLNFLLNYLLLLFFLPSLHHTVTENMTHCHCD